MTQGTELTDQVHQSNRKQIMNSSLQQHLDKLLLIYVVNKGDLTYLDDGMTSSQDGSSQVTTSLAGQDWMM